MRTEHDRKPPLLRAAEIHAQLGDTWPNVLARLGIPAERLTKKPGPCPACGGRDRFFFDNRKREGDFHCRGCGAGNGFDLLTRTFNWSFDEARQRVQECARLETRTWEPARPVPPAAEIAARPTPRVMRIVKSTCVVSDCSTAVEYLSSRHLWPLPTDFTLRAHVGVDYFDGGNRIGRYAALVASVRDITGEIVTAHVTYLEHGRKLASYEPRKLLSPLSGRTGCAVRLADATGNELGVGEGIETCLAAAALHGLPV
jgi:putative DNA primase/helicase